MKESQDLDVQINLQNLVQRNDLSGFEQFLHELPDTQRVRILDKNKQNLWNIANVNASTMVARYMIETGIIDVTPDLLRISALSNRPQMLETILDTVGRERAQELVNTPAVEHIDPASKETGTMPTLLGVAVGQNNPQVTKVLLAYGADVNANAFLEHNKQTALHITERMGFSDLSTLLRENGANEKATDHEGKTPEQCRLDPRLEPQRVQMQAATTQYATNYYTARTAHPDMHLPMMPIPAEIQRR
jgi:hypothetical protein